MMNDDLKRMFITFITLAYVMSDRLGGGRWERGGGGGGREKKARLYLL